MVGSFVVVFVWGGIMKGEIIQMHIAPVVCQE